MICKTTEDIMTEIEVYMTRHKIQYKELAIMLNKSKQSISQIFDCRNPKLNTLLEICNALNIEIEIKGDTFQ